jgi:hypothetical protein
LLLGGFRVKLVLRGNEARDCWTAVFSRWAPHMQPLPIICLIERIPGRFCSTTPNVLPSVDGSGLPPWELELDWDDGLALEDHMRDLGGECVSTS